MSYLKILFPALMVAGALGSLLVNAGGYEKYHPGRNCGETEEGDKR